MPKLRSELLLLLNLSLMRRRGESNRLTARRRLHALSERRSARHLPWWRLKVRAAVAHDYLLRRLLRLRLMVSTAAERFVLFVAQADIIELVERLVEEGLVVTLDERALGQIIDLPL